METVDTVQEIESQASTESGFSTLLLPVRYPLTATSTRTLQYAAERLEQTSNADFRVLHVNLLYRDGTARPAEIARAIEPFVGQYDPDVVVRRGMLVEGIISEEAARFGADLIILGDDDRPWWRRAFGRLLWSDPDIATHLRTQTESRIEIAT